MYKASAIIRDTFEAKKLKCRVGEVGSLSYVELPMTGDNLTVVLNYLSADDDNDVQVRTDPFAHFPADRIADGRKLANKMNQEYRFIKFVVDDDGDMLAQYDLPVHLQTKDLGEAAIEAMVHFVKIIDESYPNVMKTLWG